MLLYFAIFVFFSFFFFNSINKKADNVSFLVWAMLFLGLIVGLADMLGGYDRYIYCELFDRNADFVNAGKSPFSEQNPLLGYRSEIGYVIWNILVSYITENRYIFILITALATYALILISIKDYVKNYPFAIILFLALWFFFTFTYLRQTMAASIAWFSYRYVIKRKLIPFLICTFVAYKFHNSAIIFFPLFFLPIKKYSKKQIIVVMTLLFLIGITGFPSMLYTLYGGISDTSSRVDRYAEDNASTRFAYVIEVVVFLYFIFKRYDRIPIDRTNIVFLNATLAFCGILLFFISSSNAGRQSWYYMLGVIYMLTYLATENRKKVDGYIQSIWAIMFVLYFRIVLFWGTLLSPYKTFFTNGIRPQDQIVETFEYDWNYAEDKFYRDPWVLW